MQEKASNVPDVSVIIPVYNVAPYIRECAESLFNQTLQNIEYIFIDDASTDDSIKILEEVITEYPKRKDNIKLKRHNENKGVSISRQEGLSIATGNWVIYCDADDFIDRNAYQLLVQTAIDNNSDIVVVGYTEFDNNGNSRKNIYKKETKTNIDFLESITGASKPCLHGALWNKLIKREICNNITFPSNISYCEDVAFFIQLLTLQNNLKINIIPSSLYSYRKRQNSLITLHGEKRINEILDLILFIERWKEVSNKHFHRGLNSKIIDLLYRLFEISFPNKEYSQQFNDYRFLIYQNRRLNFMQKLFLRLALSNHHLMAKNVKNTNNRLKSVIKFFRSMKNQL